MVCLEHVSLVDNDGRVGLVTATLGALGDLVDGFLARDDLAKDGVLGGGGAVEPVEVLVVDGVDEELRTARVGGTSVGHGEGVRSVGVLGDELVGDVTAGVAGNLALSGNFEGGVGGGATGASAGRVDIAGVGAAELAHEVVDDTVEGETGVEAGADEVFEVGGGDGGVVEEFDDEVTHGGFELGLTRHDLFKK